MSALAAGLPQLTATVGTSLQTLAEGVVVAHPARDEITHAEAAALTGEIRAALHDLAAMVAAVGELVTAAWAMRADRVLGYPSWEAYCADLFADVRSTRLPVDTRRSVVVALRAAGMSTRATGSVLGVHHDTVATDLKASVGNPTGEAVVGLDGRRRAAPAPVQAEPSMPKVARALLDLDAAGTDGLTSRELGRTHRDWPAPWAILSELHARHRVARLTTSRDGYAVYVLPEHVAGRDVEAPGRRPRVSR